MNDDTRQKLGAATKMAFGVGRIASGLALGTGHGLLGGFLKSHGHLQAARGIAKHSIEAGVETFREGLADWQRASA